VCGEECWDEEKPAACRGLRRDVAGGVEHARRDPERRAGSERGCAQGRHSRSAQPDRDRDARPVPAVGRTAEGECKQQQTGDRDADSGALGARQAFRDE